jgi:hypothetical protein
MSGTRNKAMEHFLKMLWKGPPIELENVFDPWNSTSSCDVQASAVHDRRRCLALHLAAPAPRLLCTGEALGYQGCKISGVAFTSEALLLEGVIPRIDVLDVRLTERKLPWREPSATIVWNALQSAGLAERTTLWNSFPWHPHKPGRPLANRAPTR